MEISTSLPNSALQIPNTEIGGQESSGTDSHEDRSATCYDVMRKHITNNITDQDIVTSENYDTALQNFIEENNYDYNINTGLNILDEFMKEYDLDCLIRVSE